MLRKILRFADKWLGGVILMLNLPMIRRVVFGSNRGKEQGSQPQTFVIIKTVGMGDAVLILSVIDHLKKSIPNAAIIALTTPLTVGIWENQPCFAEVINYDILGKQRGIRSFLKLLRQLRGKQIDCVIDFEPYFNQTALLAMLLGAPRRIGLYYGASKRQYAFTDPVEINPEDHMLRSQMSLLEPLGIQAEIHCLKAPVVSEEDRKTLQQWLYCKQIPKDCPIVAVHAGSGGRGKARRWPRE
ncbi:MAG: glycosyltransferase family 9 protein, partial [Candidatus Omnitrophica bacterium]|nr:glycosyltransferase family 9 protein [Candidatus Omnitrophota bacterium]